MLLDSANDDGCVSLSRAVEDRNTEKRCQKPVLQKKTTKYQMLKIGKYYSAHGGIGGDDTGRL